MNTASSNRNASETVEQFEAAIKSSISLKSLCRMLNLYASASRHENDGVAEAYQNFDVTSLPTFGGEVIAKEGFFSWDETYVLVQGPGGYRQDWVIAPRSDYSEILK